MKKDLFFTVLFCFLSITCIALGVTLNSSCSRKLGNIPEVEIGDCTQEINHIDIYPEGVCDFVYQDGLFYIDYRDDDSFDMERLAEEDAFYEDSQYIIIECSNDMFFEFLELYSSWQSECNNKTIDNIEKKMMSFNIKEVITDVEGGKNYRYYLCKGE